MGESGIYPVTIAFASLDQSAKSEAIQVNFHVQYGTGEQSFYMDLTYKIVQVRLNYWSKPGIVFRRNRRYGRWRATRTRRRRARGRKR